MNSKVFPLPTLAIIVYDSDTSDPLKLVGQWLCPQNNIQLAIVLFICVHLFFTKGCFCLHCCFSSIYSTHPYFRFFSIDSYSEFRHRFPSVYCHSFWLFPCFSTCSIDDFDGVCTSTSSRFYVMFVASSILEDGVLEIM